MEIEDGYTTEPTHLRVFCEGPGGWTIDGADAHHRYTEDVRSYATWQEAFDRLPEFVDDLREDGITFKWQLYRCRLSIDGPTP